MVAVGSGAWHLLLVYSVPPTSSQFGPLWRLLSALGRYIQSLLWSKMDSNAFTQLALIELTSPCRLLVSACCPDKDLVVLTSHHGGRARLSLWKMQGSKKWEVEIGQDSATDVVAIAWSPGGAFNLFFDP